MKLRSWLLPVLLIIPFSVQTANAQWSSAEHETLSKVVIIGSYRKHLNVILNLKEKIEREGVIVTAPSNAPALNPGEDFIHLASDYCQDPKILQDSVFAKIRAASFVILANADGYLGNATLMEAGYAIAYGLQILTLEKITDPNLAPYSRLLKEVFPNLVLEPSLPEGS